MKFYSELTEQLYDTEKLLVEAEEKLKADAAAAEQRELDRIKEKTEIDEAIANVKTLIKTHVEKYGSFRYDLDDFDITINNFHGFAQLANKNI